MKKILSLVLALAMILMVGAAFADHTISVEADSTRTYAVYQIFTGTVENGKLNNIQYGQNSTRTPGEFLSQEDNATLRALTDNTGSAGDKTDIDNLASFVNLNSTPYRNVSDGSPASVPAGYYLIKETTVLQGEETATLYLMSVINENITIHPKVGTPGSDKEIGAVDSNVRVGDYNIGDTIPYTLSAVLPENYAAYKEYFFKFVDDMAPGLTLDTNSVRIKYGSGEATPIQFTNAGASSVHSGGTKYTFTTPDLVTTHTELGAGSVYHHLQRHPEF
jgi:fimbrial isopeptide formation D2 family protein